MIFLDKSIKQLPYGNTDFKEIQRKNKYYVDKTQFIPIVEQMPDYLFLIRPRRFGKSLFITVLHYYYDVQFKDEFNDIFKNTYILKNPTDERNKYLVLYFNFSAVDPSIDKTEASFEFYCKSKFNLFYAYYKQYFTEKQLEAIDKEKNSKFLLQMTLDYTKQNGLKIFIIIDEYDNFANTILSKSQSEYQRLTHDAGFYRHFFNVLKEGTSSVNATISKLFITGVSPITMDDVTSGFNIGTNISTNPHFNEAIGFTEPEVIEMINYYQSVGLIKEDTETILKIMKKWYNNYKFSKKSKTTVFNSDMVLNFFLQYSFVEEIPTDLLDDNVKTDYNKLRHLIFIDQQLNGNFSILKEIIEKKGITAQINTSFPAKDLIERDNFISLLYFFGLITFSGFKGGKPYFTIPNESIKTFYSNYILSAYEETKIFRISLYKFANLMNDMAYKGEWKELFNFLSEQIKEQTKIRDYISGEHMIKGFLLAYLNIPNEYTVTSELELNKGYADLWLEPFTIQHKEMPFSYLIEIKYLKRQTEKVSTKIKEKLVAEATIQLQKYAQDPYILKTQANTKVRKLVLIYNAWELIHIEEINKLTINN